MDTQDRPAEPPGSAPDAGRPAPWWQRVLPVTLAVAVLLAVAGTLVPGVRHQLALSLTRQPVSYVELYFARSTAAGAEAACVRKGTSVRARFIVESHLERRQAVYYRVVVDPATRGLPTRRKTAAVEVSPGQAVAVTRSFTVPRGEAYVLEVLLPSSDQQLRVRCAARQP